ncbi:MAG TPA: hypothetical protein VL463_24820, partial [Kofleriaceae bacterium]|nr:hypothetical protein [Kofleriaceae bacterium]
MREWLIAIAVVLWGACGSGPNAGAIDAAPGGADAAIDGAPNAPDAGPAATCTGAGFAVAATSFALPSGFATRAFIDDHEDTCATVAPRFALVDLDGDRAEEVVVTSLCADGAVGTSEWRVGTSSWALPPGFAARAFWGTSNDDCNAGPRYVLADLTGDLRPDLVVTSTCDQSTVGSDHWLVYANTGAGFASTAISWPLPSGFASRAFDHAHSDACGTAAPIFALEDLDGDHRPDLVVTSACDQSSLGTDHWNVYANTGSAFSAATSFALPSGFATRAFIDDHEDTCATVAPRFALVDLDGDRAEEVV